MMWKWWKTHSKQEVAARTLAKRERQGPDGELSAFLCKRGQDIVVKTYDLLLTKKNGNFNCR
jgi:hypothetical protein